MTLVLVGPAAFNVGSNLSVGARLLTEKLVDRKSEYLERLRFEQLPKGCDALVVHLCCASQRCNVNDHGDIAFQLCQIHAAAVNPYHIVELEESSVCLISSSIGMDGSGK
eukprot:SAG25_NODE_788_length_5307_cov_2.800115_2_plen_110_part_00